MAPESTTVYLRRVPRSVVRAAKAEAARRGQTLAHVVSDAIRRALEPGSDAPATDALEADFEWFEKHRAKLQRRYAGEYVAIVDDAVVDHDTDFGALATRVFERHGTRSIFMPRVERAAAPARLRSPRVERA